MGDPNSVLFYFLYAEYNNGDSKYSEPFTALNSAGNVALSSTLLIPILSVVYKEVSQKLTKLVQSLYIYDISKILLPV